MYPVLIAEDEYWLRRELSEMVERLGENFTIAGEACDGEQAWEMIPELWPSILITDIRMPRMDGIDLIKRVTDAAYPIVILVVSGYDEFAYAQKAVHFGVTDYLLKPIDSDKLKSALLHSLDRISLFKDLNACLTHINAFFETIHDSEVVERNGMLEEIIGKIWGAPILHPKSRHTLLTVFQTKMNELLQEGGTMSDAGPQRELLVKDREQSIDHFRRLLEQWSLKASSKDNGDMHAIIRKACRYVENHYMEPLTLVGIASEFHLSMSYFGYLFKKYTGQSFISYVNQLRVDKAKVLLLEEDIKIYDIAEMVGFSSQTHFNRTFKNLIHMTPNEFRKGMMG